MSLHYQRNIEHSATAQAQTLGGLMSEARNNPMTTSPAEYVGHPNRCNTSSVSQRAGMYSFEIKKSEWQKARNFPILMKCPKPQSSQSWIKLHGNWVFPDSLQRLAGNTGAGSATPSSLPALTCLLSNPQAVVQPPYRRWRKAKKCEGS